MFLFEWHERYILHFTLVNQTPTELQLLGHRKKKLWFKRRTSTFKQRWDENFCKHKFTENIYINNRVFKRHSLQRRPAYISSV